MPYLSLPNFNHDSGPRRIQSGPDHEGYVVLYSGVQSTGADEGIVVAGAPLSGTLALGAWDYDANWRYVPSTPQTQSGGLDPTPYNVSGALDTYDGVRIYTRNTVAGAQIASAIGPQPGSTVYRPEKYMYYGGAAPDNQNYSPYNTPDANSAAEGKTGGGVTHRTFESSLLTNVLGSQGTSDRSQWRYHQPVYCKTYTETKRSGVPGLMSTPLRAVYRGGASSYGYNYGYRGGFQLLPPDDQTLGCPFPVGCPTNSGSPTQIVVGDTLSAVVYCDFVKVEWFNSDNALVGSGLTYTTTSGDVGYRLFFTVTYADDSTDSSPLNCFPVVVEFSFRFWYQKWGNLGGFDRDKVYGCVVDNNGDMYVVRYIGGRIFPCVSKISNNVTLQWSKVYPLDPAFIATAANSFGQSYFLLNSGENSIDFLAHQWSGTDNNPTFPIRIYRYRISKTDGSIINVAAVDFTPPGSPSSSFIQIKDVKIDFDNNYYFIGVLPINNEVLTTGVYKFTENLTFVWCRMFPALRYRGTGTCLVQVRDGDLFAGLTIGDSGIVGFTGLTNSSIDVELPYYSLSVDGDTLSSARAKFDNPNISSTTTHFTPRSICRDSQGNVYGIGGYSGSLTIGTFDTPIVVYKDSPSDTTIWAKNIKTIFNSVVAETNSILVIDSKLVVTFTWNLPITRTVVIKFNLETGTIEQALNIRNLASVDQRTIIQQLPEESKFIVQTNYGYTYRLDVNNLPADGEYVCTDDPGTNYTVSGLSLTPTDHTFYRFTGCSVPTLISRDMSAYFSAVTPVVTVSGETGGAFRHFAGQDIP